jgi:3-dehydroquinate synthase
MLVCRTVALLEQCKLPTTPPPEMTPQDFMDIMAVDKKVKDGKLRLILLKGALGSCVVTGDFDPAALDATLSHFCTRKTEAS